MNVIGQKKKVKGEKIDMVYFGMVVSVSCLNKLSFTNKIPKKYTFEKILRMIKLARNWKIR